MKAGNKCLEFYGANAIDLKVYRDTFTFPIIHFYKKLGLDIDRVLEKKDEANRIFQTEYERLVTNARTRSGARQILKWANENDMGCIILSNYITPRIEEQLARLKIRHYFEHVCGNTCEGTTVLEHMTKAGRLQKYMTAAGYAPKNTYIIGDSAEEPMIARQLGLTSIAITDGYISRARLNKANPDHIIHSLSKLKTLFETKTL